MAYESLAALFLAQARRNEHRTLYRFFRDGGWQSYSWEQAASIVEEIALGLTAMGTRKGDRVALLSANRVEWCLIDWADICIGALTVPLYSSSTPAEAHAIIEHAEASVLIVDTSRSLGKLDSRALELAGVRASIVIDHDDSPSEVRKTISLDCLRDVGRGHGRKHPEMFRELASSLRPEDDLTIIYTSGTTGEPKGVVTTHDNYLFAIQSALEAIPCRADDVGLQFLPFAHSFGRLEHFVVVARGYSFAIARSIDTLAADLQMIKPTLLFSVPRVYENAYHRIRARMRSANALRQALFHWAVSVGLAFNTRRRTGGWVGPFLRLAYAVADRTVLAKVRAAFGGRLRLAVSGGAPLAPALADFLQGVGIAILEGYGLTETSTVTHVNRMDRFRVGTVGLPLDGVECCLAEDGEILIRGRNVLKQYYKDPAGTLEAVNGDGWFRTGDIGEIDDGGFLRITDRKKDLIVTSGGKNIAPQRIENLLRRDPVISQALVWGDRTSHLVALITLNHEEIATWASQQGFELKDRAEAACDPRVVQYLRQKIRGVNKQLAAFEAIRNFRIVAKDFSTVSGELTPSLKLRRRIVMEKYRDVLNEMLEGRGERENRRTGETGLRD